MPSSLDDPSRRAPATLIAGSIRSDETLVMSAPRVPPADAPDETLVMARAPIFDAPERGRRSRPSLVRVGAAHSSAPAAPTHPAPPTPESAADSGQRTVVPACDSDRSLSAVERPSASAPAQTDEGTKPAAQRVGGAFVKAYRVAGFVILAAILGGLATYIGTHLFFLFNRSWVAPSILTPADPRVLGFASRFVEESARKDALLVQRAEVESRRREAERMLAIERTFQGAYDLAMQADLADRKAELARARGMLGAYSVARKSIASASEAFRSSSELRLKEELEAGVIDKDRMLSGNLQLAQIADARLSLDARNAEMHGRVAALTRMVDSLAVAADHGRAVSSYDVLKIRADYDRSVAAAAKASDELEATTKSLEMLDETIRAEVGIIQTMKRSAYHGVASSGRAVFAFVPYENSGSARAGAPVYACRVGVLWCREIGRLSEAAEGEVTQKHPLLHQDLRGVFVRLEVDDIVAAESAVLHVGRRPLFL